jgi:hypothetical protein
MRRVAPIGLIKIVAVSLAMLNAALVGAYLYRLRQTMSSASANGAEILWDMTIPRIHIRITLALALAAICLFIRNRLGIAACVISLGWVMGEYARWFLILQEIRQASGTSQPAPLFGFEWWSLAVLGLATILLVLLLRAVFERMAYGSERIETGR